MSLAPEINAVLDRHLPPTEGDVEWADVPAELEPSLLAIGLDPRYREPVDGSLVAAIAAALEAGFATESLLPVAQAYARGLGRIVAAEADNFRRLLRGLPEADQAAELDRVLRDTLPAVRTVFEVMHTTMLRDALRDALSVESLDEPDQPDRVVALVDLCASTAYLESADRSSTRAMVDALYEAGRAAQIGRAVWTVKYVGDGVFLVGHDVVEVTEAALDSVASLERSLPLQARAGVARGPVVRRAGDYFGPVVNLAQRLTTVAPPTTVAVAEPAAGELARDAVGDRREVELRGIEGPVSVALVSAATANR